MLSAFYNTTMLCIVEVIAGIWMATASLMTLRVLFPCSATSTWTDVSLSLLSCVSTGHCKRHNNLSLFGHRLTYLIYYLHKASHVNNNFSHNQLYLRLISQGNPENNGNTPICKYYLLFITPPCYAL